MHRDSRTFKIRSSPTARFGTETFDVSPLLRILHASLPSQPRDRPISFQTNINVDPCPAEDQDSMIYCQAQHTYQSTCISSILRKHTTTSSRSRLANVAVHRSFNDLTYFTWASALQDRPGGYAACLTAKHSLRFGQLQL